MSTTAKRQKIEEKYTSGLDLRKNAGIIKAV